MIVFYLEKTIQVKFCGKDFPWWMPLAVACVFLSLLHIISIVLILHFLSKALDPIQLLKMSTSCCLTNFFEPIWNEDQKDILEPISNFLEEASMKTNKGKKIEVFS